MIDDATLLRRYAEERSEEAFSELVRRHIDFVFSVALREVRGDFARAQDVTQSVFTVLARKASVLQGRKTLVGWLHISVHHDAAKLIRGEQRRQRREQEARAMHEPANSFPREDDWERLKPVLNEVVQELSDVDRDAVLLRFYQRQRFVEIGHTLRISEDAAQKRLERALQKMRASLTRRGITSTSTALAAMLEGHAVGAAPAGLAANIVSGALAAASGTSGITAIKGLLFMNKVNIGITAILVVAGSLTGLIELRANRALRNELSGLQAQKALDRSPTETNGPSPSSQKAPDPTVDTAELDRLRGRIEVLKARPDGVVDADMKSREAWRNAGHTTPETALETLLWASQTGDLDTLARSYAFNDAAKAKADALFATLSEDMRMKYGTPERFFAPLLMESWKNLPLAAYQVSDQINPSLDQVELQLWSRSIGGLEHDAGKMPFVHGPDGWKFGPIGFDLNLARFDPATGELRSEAR